MWIGSIASRSTLHYDANHNILSVISVTKHPTSTHAPAACSVHSTHFSAQGCKHVTLFPPNSSDLLYVPFPTPNVEETTRAVPALAGYHA